MKKILILFLLLAISCTDDTVSPNTVPPNTNLSTFNKNVAEFGNYNELDIVLSEICYQSASNYDEDGDNSDWIEIFNKGNDTINLQNYYLSDNDSITKWNFPDIDIAPKSFITVFASGKDIREMAEPAKEIEVLSDNVWSWVAGDPDEAQDSGKSFVKPWKFKDFVGEEDGVLKISGSFIIGDNNDLSVNNMWSTAVIHSDFDKKYNNDFSMFSAFYLKGYIDKDKKIDIVFPQTNKENWECPIFTLIGKGNEDDEYIIPFRLQPNIEKDKLTAIEFRGSLDVFTTTNFTFSSLKFTNEKQNFHTNFNLKAGEIVSLYNAKNNLIDSKETSETLIGGSVVRDLINGKWATASLSTFEKENVAGESLITSPIFTKKSGFYTDSVEVKINAKSGSNIYYTLNGSIPTQNSKVYHKPLVFTKTTVLKSIAIFENGKSDITTSTYFVNEETELPVFSISTEPNLLFHKDTGIYMKGPNANEKVPYYGANFWLDKRIPINIEFFEDDKKLEFNEGAGLKIFGNWSRAGAKKSLAIKFSKEYGKANIYQKFFKYTHPDFDYFDSFVLRARRTVRDGLVSTIAENIGIGSQKYRPAVVFINGEYWGIHNIREKLDENYFATNYNIDKEEVNIIREKNKVQYGDCSDFIELLNFMKNNSLKDSTNYQTVQNWMDVDNFIDYQVTQMFIVNTDWPQNNWRAWKTNDANSKWQWIIFDTDLALGGGENLSEQYEYNIVDTDLAFGGDENLGKQYEYDMFEHTTRGRNNNYNDAESTLMFRSLLKNEIFQRKFTNRALAIVSKYFNKDVLLDSIASFSLRIENEVPKDLAKWWPDGGLEFHSNDHAKMLDFAENRYGYFLQHMIDFFDYKGSYTIEFSTQGNGSISIEGKNIGTHLELDLIEELPVEIEAIPNNGSIFIGWSDGSKEAKRLVDLSGISEIVAEFK